MTQALDLAPQAHSTGAQAQESRKTTARLFTCHISVFNTVTPEFLSFCSTLTVTPSDLYFDDF